MTYRLSQYGDSVRPRADMDRKDRKTPLSESSVSLKLAEIQKRCGELMDEPGALLELSLEEPLAEHPKSNDPYNHYLS